MIDDSQHQGGPFILAGYIADAAAWAEFSREWEELLPLTSVGRSGRRRFKMAEMAGSPELKAHVPAFFRVIEKHVFASVSAKIHIPDLRRIQSRMMVPGHEIDWGIFGDPYYVTFRCLIDTFHSQRQSMAPMIPEEESVDFFFDETNLKRQISASWNDYIAASPKTTRRFIGAAPTFKDDEEFLPLQSADFWAWWVRKWHVEGTPEKVQKWDFDGFGTSSKKKLMRMEIVFDQDMLAKAIAKTIRTQLDHDGKNDVPIIDLRSLDSFSGRP